MRKIIFSILNIPFELTILLKEIVYIGTHLKISILIEYNKINKVDYYQDKYKQYVLRLDAHEMK